MSWMPSGLSERVRFLFASFAVLVAPLSGLYLLDADVPVLPNGVATLVALVAIAVWSVQLYRCGGLPRWADVVPSLALFVAGWQLGGPDALFGLMFVIMFGRALYDSRARVWVNVAGYFVAYEAAVMVTGGFGEAEAVSFVVTGLGLVAATGVMLLVGEVLRAHEQTIRHEKALARAASRLQLVSTRDEACDVATEETAALTQDTSDTAVVVWQADQHTIWVRYASAGHGTVAVAVSELPAAVRTALLAGEALLVTGQDRVAVARLAGTGGSYRSMLLAPLARDGALVGVLVAVSMAQLPQDLVAPLRLLAVGVGIALGRVESERALHASEQQFRSMSHNISQGLYQMSLRPTLRFDYVNPAMEAITGFAAQAFLDDVDLPLQRVHPDDRAAIRATRSHPDEVVGPVEVRWLLPSGEWVWHSLQESVVSDVDGVAVSTLGIISDVTSRKLQEQATQEALERERDATETLRRVDAMRTTFIQAISHELRTPLTAITGYAHTLWRNHDTLDGQVRGQMLERLQVNAGTLDRLLADLLDVDRLSAHHIEPVRRPTDILELVRRVVAQIEGATDQVVCHGDAVVAQVEASKVERIVENLVRNARKHTAVATPIDVSVVAHESGNGVVVRVADEGPGIADELLDTVFDPFVQGPGSADHATPGMGIGLSLVARFAQMHGGEATVVNGERCGAVFSVWLPDRPPVGPVGGGHGRGSMVSGLLPDPPRAAGVRGAAEGRGRQAGVMPVG